MKRSLYLIPFFLFIIRLGLSQTYYDHGPIVENNFNPLWVPEPGGRTWDCPIITYFFLNGTADISGNLERNAIRAAMDMWEEHSFIRFVEVTLENNADIRILWGTGNHGDPIDCGACDFDGQNGILAHAFFPPPNLGDFAGDMHFDDSELWTLDLRNSGAQPIDLVTVAAHELGHSLGLDHTNVPNSLMNAIYNGSHRFLGADDIEGIQALYPNPALSISGPQFLCSTNSFTLNNLPVGNTVSWSVTPANLFTGSISGVGLTANLSPLNTNSSGQATLVYSVTTECGDFQISQVFWVGKGTIGIYGAYDMPTNTVENYYATADGSVTNYNWSIYPSGYEWIGNQGNPGITLTISHPGNYSLGLDVTNPCGVRGSEIPIYVYDPWSMFVIYPNPASDIMTVSKRSTLSSKQMDTTSFEISVFDSKGQQLAGPVSGNEDVGLDVSHLKNGFYFVHISYKGHLIKNQIKVER